MSGLCVPAQPPSRTSALIPLCPHGGAPPALRALSPRLRYFELTGTGLNKKEAAAPYQPPCKSQDSRPRLARRLSPVCRAGLLAVESPLDAPQIAKTANSLGSVERLFRAEF